MYRTKEHEKESCVDHASTSRSNNQLPNKNGLLPEDQTIHSTKGVEPAAAALKHSGNKAHHVYRTLTLRRTDKEKQPACGFHTVYCSSGAFLAVGAVVLSPHESPGFWLIILKEIVTGFFLHVLTSAWCLCETDANEANDLGPRSHC